MKPKKGFASWKAGPRNSPTQRSTKNKESGRLKAAQEDLGDNIKQKNIRVIEAPEKRKRKRQKTYLKKSWLKESFPNWGEGNRHPDPRSSERFKHDEHSETCTKTQD